MILITGHARCGSTAVAYWVDNIYSEGLNDNMIRFDEDEFRKTVCDTPKEDRIALLKEKGYAGNKDLYMYLEDYLPDMIERKDFAKIVVLIRNDLFSQVFSNCVCIQMNQWHGQKDFVRKGSLSHIPVDLFSYQLRTCFKNNKKLIETFKDVDEAKVFIYEDLFSVSERQCEAWEDLFSFLNLDFSSKKLFRINQKRYNGIDTQSKIENIAELRHTYMEFIYESLNCSYRGSTGGS